MALINTGEYKLELVDADSPERCLHTNHRNTQCMYRKIPGKEFCSKHYNNYTKEKVRNYRLSKWQARVEEFSDSSELKSLREEIGILRLTLETVLGRCQDDHELVLYSNRISDMVLKIEKLVSSCHRLEMSTSMLLDKTLVLQIANVIIEIIGNHVKDSTVLDTISDEIIQTILKTSRLDIE